MTARSRTPLFALLLLLVFLPSPAGAAFKGTPGRLAVVDDDGALQLIDPEGARPPVILDTEAAGYAPSWSPDGTRLTYVKNVPDTGGTTHTAIFVIDADGANRRQVTAPAPAIEDVTNDDIGLCDTHDPTFDGGEHTDDVAPAWSPDGTAIAFVRQFSGNPGLVHLCAAYDICSPPWEAPPEQNVWTVSLAGSEQRLTHDTVPYSGGIKYAAPVWSADGRVAAMVSTFTGCALEPGSDVAIELDTIGPGGARTPQPVTGDQVSTYDFSPDGTRLAVLEHPDHVPRVTVIDADGTPHRFPELTSFYRFSPDGNGLMMDGCATDRSGAQKCGLVEHRLPDPGADVRDDEPPDTYFAPPLPDIGLGADAVVTGTTSRVDVQPQQLPIVFVPGFLGSEIKACGAPAWPPGLNTFRNNSRLAKMALETDGATNATCADAGPTGEVVKSVLGGDVYGSSVAWLEANAPGGTGPGHVVLGWDWRRGPGDNLKALDDAITRALDTDAARRAGLTRVVIFAHSYGGLLTRDYLNDPAHAQRVDRVLTAGSPFWGAPKAIFPIAAGIETPLEHGLGLDTLLDNDTLKAFASTLRGAYELLPSAHYGPWLELNGAATDVSRFISRVGGHASIYAAAQADHARELDGFFDDDGRIDVRAVAGTGLLTAGRVNFIPALDATTVGLVNGDETVPEVSALQGTDPEHPLGDPIHVQEVCGVTHMALTGSANVLGPYKDFLLYGRTPRLTEGACSAHGAGVVLEDVEIGDLAGARSAARGALSPAEAARDGLVDLFDLADPLVVLDRSRPVTLAFKARGAILHFTPYDDGAAGRTTFYGPLRGAVRLALGGPGQPPTVTVNGKHVKPRQRRPAATLSSHGLLRALGLRRGTRLRVGHGRRFRVGRPARLPAIRLSAALVRRHARIARGSARIRHRRAVTLRVALTRAGRRMLRQRRRFAVSAKIVAVLAPHDRVTATTRLRLVARR